MVETETLAQVSAALTIALVVAGALLTGPGVGVLILDSGDTIGDGNAEIQSVSVATDRLQIDQGRFGTGMAYLRVPDAVVDIVATDGRSRLVYRLTVPELGIERDATTTVRAGATGRYRLAPQDIALDPEDVGAGRYDAVVTVRVQSFAIDRTVYNRTATVEVRR